MLLGVDYYPEQWDVKMIDEDLENILELGGNVIRIGEFAWHLMEKEEGKFDFSFFDNVIKKAKEKGIKIIFGTPTATIPAWLVKKYPDILSELENGQKIAFGGRHVNCYNNGIYWEYSEKIVRALLEHYKDEEAIIAWQIDNEIGHEGSDICYCSNCKNAFQKFLKRKFNNSIEDLNNTYGTTFWSQEYNDFDEIPLPTTTIAVHNPALRLDWERFRSETLVSYINFQVGLIKEIIPNTTIIHDFAGGGLNKHVDYSEVAKELDVVAFNNYPVWGGQKEPIKPYEIAFGLEYMRGLKRKNYWITEGIMGAQGHDITGFLPRPNQAKMWSYQSIARGAEALLYFRYRGATKGAEQFCYGILDADNQKRRKFKEVKELFHHIKNYEESLKVDIKSKVAMLYDFDSLASFRIQRQSLTLDCETEMKKIYEYFYDRNITMDIIPYNMDFSKYEVLILPFMIVWKEELLLKIREFLSKGGKVVMTYRTGVKDKNNNLTLNQMLPIGYRDIVKVRVEETESLQEYDSLTLEGVNDFKGVEGKAGIFRDMLVSEGAEILFKYTDKFYNEFSAVTRASYGKGETYYLGCGLGKELLNKLFDKILVTTTITQTLAPKGIEIVERGEKDNKIIFYINHNDFEVEYGDKYFKPFECKIETIK